MQDRRLLRNRRKSPRSLQISSPTNYIKHSFHDNVAYSGIIIAGTLHMCFRKYFTMFDMLWQYYKIASNATIAMH